MLHRRTLLKTTVALGAGWAARYVRAEDNRVPIRGHVLAGGEGLAGVRCSDGRQVVTTDSQGRFSLPAVPDAGPFVFVVLPRGYWSEQFYLPRASAPADMVFKLNAGPAYERHTAVYMTDLHLEGDKEAKHARFVATIDEINALPQRPALVLTGGDICLQSAAQGYYTDLMSRLKMPVRTAMGNHEMITDQPDPHGLFHRLFGPSYYSFDCGLVHYVVLDGCRYNPKSEGWKNVIGEFSECELAWLKQDLIHVPKGVPTICVIHIPLVSTGTERRGVIAAESPWWIVRNAEAVVDILKEFNVQLVLQGHLHENERIRRNSIEFAETVAVAGSWWRSKSGRELGVSQEPRGYRVIEADGNRVTHRYVPSAESRTDAPGEFCDLEGDRLAAGKPLTVNLYDAGNDAKVTGRIDGGPEQTWELVKPIPNTKASTPAHHWRFAGQPLSPGAHTVELRCVDAGRPDATLSRRILLA